MDRVTKLKPSDMAAAVVDTAAVGVDTAVAGVMAEDEAMVVDMDEDTVVDGDMVADEDTVAAGTGDKVSHSIHPFLSSFSLIFFSLLFTDRLMIINHLFSPFHVTTHQQTLCEHRKNALQKYNHMSD